MKFMQGFFFLNSVVFSNRKYRLKSLHLSSSYFTSSNITHTDIQAIMIILYKYGTNKQDFLPSP